MLTHLNPLFRLVAQTAVLFTPLASIAQETDRQVMWPISIAVQTETGKQIPAGAYGVVQIQTPRVANLLQLRGVIGRGIAIIRSDDSHDCQILQLRFVAGDFGGDSVSTHAAKPIRLVLRSAPATASRSGENQHEHGPCAYRRASHQRTGCPG